MPFTYNVDSDDPEFCLNLLLTVFAALAEKTEPKTRERDMLEKWLRARQGALLQ